MNFPQAYHITWGTYGTRLHGDDRPTVDLEHNQYGEPFVERDPKRKDEIRRNLAHDPVYLTHDQRVAVERGIRDTAEMYRWVIHALAAQSDHVHVVISALRDGKPLREAIKAAASRELNRVFGKNRWWAEGGSVKYLFEDEYFYRAKNYVREQRDF